MRVVSSCRYSRGRRDLSKVACSGLNLFLVYRLLRGRPIQATVYLFAAFFWVLLGLSRDNGQRLPFRWPFFSTRFFWQVF